MIVTQQVAVITGASSGIGLETARALAGRGFRVIGVGRDPGRCASAQAELADAGAFEMLRGDLSLLAEAERLADEIAARTQRVDILMNNAGGMGREQFMTPEGREGNFTANFTGPFVLTARLLPLMRRAAQDAPRGSVRIVNTSSNGSEMIPTLDLDDMESLANWSAGGSYCCGKLANVLHARGLAARLEADGIVAHSVHPGTIDSNFFSHTPDSVQEAYADTPKLTNAQGADTLIWLATSDEAGKTSGGYWSERTSRKPNPVVEDPEFVTRFWAAAEKLAGQPGI